MRYWTYVEPNNPEEDDWSPKYETYSEDEIIKEYWEYWCDRMIEAGKDLSNYNQEDCIDDWTIIHQAWESV